MLFTIKMLYIVLKIVLNGKKKLFVFYWDISK